jgi:glutamine synthetase
MAAIESAPRATSDPFKRAEVLEHVKEQGIQFVLLWFTDLEGHLKSFAITPAELEGALDDGMGFDGSSITGFNVGHGRDPRSRDIPADAVEGRRVEGRANDL